MNAQDNDRFLWVPVAGVQQRRHNITLIRLLGCVVTLTMRVLTSCLPSLMPQDIPFPAEVVQCSCLLFVTKNQAVPSL